MRRALYILTLLAVITSCARQKEKVDTSDISYELEIHRFEDELMNIHLDSIEQGVERLHREYGEFLDLFSLEIIQIGPVGNPSYPDFLRSFVTDYMINDVYDQVKEKYSDITWLEKTLEDGLKRYTYYFEDKPLPRVLTYISGFNHSMAVTDSVAGIGLDKYLGSDNDYYNQLGYANYIKRNMVAEKIPTDFIKALALTHFEYDDTEDNLLRQMIYHGKVMYFVDKMLPEEADSLVFGYTQSELTFCRNHEEQMWVFLVEHKLLFTTDQFTIIKYIGEAPFTKDFTNESPGQAAIWLGYRIVEKFMKENPDYTLADLMDMKDYQFILEESHYNP
jgi:hypothetical protein